MKMQIISKLVKNDSQASTLSSSRNTLTSVSNLLPRRLPEHPESEYFPKRSVENAANRLRTTRQVKLRDFFDNFQSNCRSAYERVDIQTAPLRRSLTPMLESLASTPSITPFKDEYQVSFKKASPNVNSFRNQTVQAEAEGSAGYYIQQSKTKIKLRKFHSLMYIKRQQPQTNRFTHQIPTKRNLSLVRKEGNSLIRLMANSKLSLKDRLHTENAEQLRPPSSKPSQPRLKSEAFEQQKQRLCKIRRELHQIYQSKKQMRVRLY